IHRNARHAVRIDAAEIGPDQDVGDGTRIAFREPPATEHGRGEPSQRLGRDDGGRRRHSVARGIAHSAGKYFWSQLRTSVTTSVLSSASTKWSTLATRCKSVGWPACTKRSIDCSVGVTESFAGWSSSSGRGAILPTTSFARNVYMLSTTSNGNSMIDPAATLPRSAGGMGTMS